VFETTEVTLNTLRIFLTTFTSLVAIGLVLEYKTALWNILRLVIKVLLLRSSPFERCTLRKLSWHSLGAILVTVGVLGEFWVEFRQYGSEGKLARESAETIGGLRVELGKEQRAIKGYDLKIATAESEAAASKAIAEGEKLERRKLEVRLGPRSLDFAKQQMITDALRKFSGHPQVSVTSYGQDAEAWALGAQLIEIISVATKVAPSDRRSNLSVTGGFETGITIRGPTSEGAFMEALRAALTDIGELKEVTVNGPILVPGLFTAGPVARGGPISQGGQARVLPAAPSSSGPVAIMVAVKPVPISLQKLK